MSPLKIDHDGVPVTKVVFWGTTLAGKTTILKTMGLVKALETPDKIFEFRRIEDEETMRTTGFDLLVLGVGSNKANPKLPLLKIHLFTVPGQERFKAIRKVVQEGLHGLIITIDSTKERWEENRRALTEIWDIVGDELSSGQLPSIIIVNKMDLPPNQRIAPQDISDLAKEAGIFDKAGEILQNVYDVSCLQSIQHLGSFMQTVEQEDEVGKVIQTIGKALLIAGKDRPLDDGIRLITKVVDALLRKKSVDKAFGGMPAYLKQGNRPEHIKRILMPMEHIVRAILIKSRS
ncbi:MAG: hypothetical protein ACFFBD_04355 [Candidatus Hodarchaeota archaeon]